MTKAEIVEDISYQTNLTKKDIGAIIDVFMLKVKKEISDDAHIELRGFGTFGTKKRNKRIARNPKTNEKLFIPNHKVVYFKPGKELRIKVRNLSLIED